MINVRLAGDHLPAGDVFGGVLFYTVFFTHERSWVRSWTELGQFLSFFTYLCSV